jgi:hypothetical protein
LKQIARVGANCGNEDETLTLYETDKESLEIKQKDVVGRCWAISVATAGIHK